ncbi:MAG: hypothetical protein FIB01_08510 [Gemmatimonadetes bacterium]|nr:hypothetical protein [Gemmatimonadota bacterium]
MTFGCRDVGLPDRNLPLDQAEQRTYGYPVYQALPDSAPVLQVAGHRWQATAPIETIEARLLAAVGNANGTAVYALTWDKPPYDRLYALVGENRWRVIERID